MNDHPQPLNGLELSVLLCLVAQKHLIIENQLEDLDDLICAVKQLATAGFGLSFEAVKDFCDSKYRSDKGLPNVLIMLGPIEQDRNLVLQLVISRVLTYDQRTIRAPDVFLVIFLVPPPEILMEHVLISYRYGQKQVMGMQRITQGNIEGLRHRASNIHIDMEIYQYLHNIVVFLRMHRAVIGGTDPAATQGLILLVKCLATLRDMSYVTPDLVRIAARMVYQSRIVLATVQTERSMQYGSNAALVQQLLDTYTTDRVLDDVLSKVEVPL